VCVFVCVCVCVCVRVCVSLLSPPPTSSLYFSCERLHAVLCVRIPALSSADSSGKKHPADVSAGISYKLILRTCIV
jgi:hypothetical protein